MSDLNFVFVFGSNLAGRHGKGAALFARKKHGAIYGQGIGYQGNSYGIPTKGHKLERLSLNIIARHVTNFLNFANTHPELQFQVTRIGCGLAGNKELDIKPMFNNASNNCHFDWLN